MRELIRVGLRFCFIMLLLGGCIHNVYHFGMLARKQHEKSVYYHQQFEEPIEEIENVVDTPLNDDSIYQDYNEDRVRDDYYRY